MHLIAGRFLVFLVGTFLAALPRIALGGPPPIKAEAGAETITQIKPDWCEGYESQKQLFFDYPWPATLVNNPPRLNIRRVAEEILSIKEKPEGLQVAFKPTKLELEDYQCSETNKIERIDRDGSIHYRQDCKSTGRYYDSVAREPEKFDRKWKDHLKPRRLVAFFDRGGVEAVYDNAKSKKLLVFGFLDEVFPVVHENP